MNVCAQRCVHQCVHIGGKRKILDVLLYHSPPYPLGTGSLIELEASNFALASQPERFQGLLVSISQCQCCRHMQPCPAFLAFFSMGAGDSNLDSHASKGFYPPSHLPGPQTFPLSTIRTLNLVSTSGLFSVSNGVFLSLAYFLLLSFCSSPSLPAFLHPFFTPFLPFVLFS